MPRPRLCCALLLLAAAAAQAQAPKLVEETWHAAYFEGARAGHVHTTVQQAGSGDDRILRTTRALHLSVRRYGKVIPLRIDLSTDEKPDGKVVALSFTQFTDKGGKLTASGKVEGDKLIVRTSSGPGSVALPWAGTAIGMYRQDCLFKLRKAKPGDKLDYVSYELALGAPLTVRATVKGAELTDVLVAGKDGKVARAPKKLVRVETRADKVKVGEETIELPAQVIWLDSGLLPVRYEQEFPGVGRFTLYKTTKEAAQKEGVAPDLLPDLGLNSIVRLKTPIEKPHETTAAVYRITLKGDADPATAFARDARQQVRNVKGKTFELHVKAVREPVKVEKPGAAGKEYLESSYFLDCDKLRMKVLAGRLTRGEKDDWAKARKIEKWVHANMRGSNDVGFARASQVAVDLAGDCRQHAMLTAALCRAAKVPARTAVGLVYGEGPEGKPALIFHMWTEVWVRGQWLGVDATLGRGGIGACHLKVADHSWRDTQTLAPLLPVARVMGKMAVEVVSAR